MKRGGEGEKLIQTQFDIIFFIFTFNCYLNYNKNTTSFSFFSNIICIVLEIMDISTRSTHAQLIHEVSGSL